MSTKQALSSHHNITPPSYKYKDSHYKDKKVSLIHINKNISTNKDGLDIETEPRCWKLVITWDDTVRDWDGEYRQEDLSLLPGLW